MKITILLLFSTGALSAADIYFAPTSAGSNNGTNCANAYLYSDGTHGWSQSAQQTAGNNLHICSGTYTVSSGGQILSTANAGTSGNPITMIADQGAAVFTSAIFSSGAAIAISKSWWTINGNNALTLQNTANGTGLANNAQTGAFLLSSTISNVLIENMIIQNLCQRSSGDVGDSCVSGGNDSNGIWLNGSSFSNITIQGVTISQGGHAAIFYSGSGSDTGILFQKNTISGSNWAIGGNTGTNGLTIFGNDLTCVVAAVCNWNETADDNHHNGIFLFPPDGASAANVVIASNFIHDINGNTTGYIFLTTSGSTGNIPSAQIYNNVLFTTSGQSGPANGMITGGPSINPSPLTANNTFSGPASQGISQDSNGTIKNNIVTGVGCQVSFNSGQTGIVSAYNDFFNWGTPPCQSTGEGWFNGSSGFTTLAAWRSGSTGQCSGGCDVTGSINTNPNLTAGFVPNTGSPVIGTGTNLTSLGITGLDTGAPQAFGVSYACGTGCLARSASNPWDMGAYPFSGSTPAPSGAVCSGPCSVFR